MDDTQSDTDKIRAKRLAKLGGSGTPRPDSSAPNPPPTTSTPIEPSLTDTTDGANEKPATPPIDRSKLLSNLEAQKTATSPARAPVRITVQPRQTSPGVKRERDGAERPRPTPRPEENAATWEDKTLKQIYRVTLKEGETKDLHGHKLVYLSGVKGDGVELLTVDNSDSILAEGASYTHGKIFEYFLQCFKRSVRASKDPRNLGSDEKAAVLKEARRMSMSYCIFAITMPDMFPDYEPTTNALVDCLLGDPESDHGICTDFLTEAVSRWDDDEMIKDTIVGAAEILSLQLAKKDMLDDYLNYITALRNLLRFSKILDAVTQSPMWMPVGIEAQDIETKSLLGPFFRLSPMQQVAANSYFSAPKTRDKGFIANAQSATRMTLKTHQEQLFMITDGIIRAGPATRNRMLDWFALCVNKNHHKRAMRVDYKRVSSDGFLVNVTSVLDRLCSPFIDASFGKVDRIDVDYLRRNPRVDIKDETKINADQKTSDAFYETKVSGTNNFISELFFLTVAAHHYGTEAAQVRMTTMRKSVKRYEKDLLESEGERHKFISDARYLARFDAHINKMKQQIDDMWSTIHATTGVLLDDSTQKAAMDFMRYVMVWLMRLASGQSLPKEQLQLPLPSQQPEAFKCLPEYFVEGVVDNFKFVTQNLPQAIVPTQTAELVQFAITLLRSSEYVKNVSVKSGLVTIMYFGIMPYGSRPGVLHDQLLGSDFANKHLLHALMKFYIEAENTGSHTQFFDKFNIRYEIFQVVKRIWINTKYRENLAIESQQNTAFFVQFVNMMVNDVTFVLDESLSSLQKVNELTTEMADFSAMQGLSEEQKKEKQELLEDHKGRAKSYLGLTTTTMESLILFTETLADAFTMQEIVTRLADMLDYNLDILVGEKRKQMIVKDDELKKAWQPKSLLAEIMTVYVNLSQKQEFISAIAKDGRSYKPQNFAEARDIMSHGAFKSPEQLRIWTELGVKVAEAKALDDQEEADLGEIPEEYEDPLMGTIMLDPVTLPSSKSVVDRSTIRTHLLSDPTDPFNRVPLKIEEVIDNVELKQQIDAWRAQKKAERAKVLAGAEPMDTTEG